MHRCSYEEWRRGKGGTTLSFLCDVIPVVHTSSAGEGRGVASARGQDPSSCGISPRRLGSLSPLGLTLCSRPLLRVSSSSSHAHFRLCLPGRRSDSLVRGRSHPGVPVGTGGDEIACVSFDPDGRDSFRIRLLLPPGYPSGKYKSPESSLFCR